jgi:beta-glucanase (GH16 family)
MRPDAARPARRTRAAVTLVLAAASLVVAALPAGGAPAWWPFPPRPTTTTTAAPTTTSTQATTSTSSTTTTTAPTTTSSTSTTTSTSSTTTTAPPSSPCGSAITKADGTPWQCTFAENFDGTTLDGSKWIAQTTAASAYTHGGGCYVDDPDNVSVSGGSLKLTVRSEPTPFVCASPNGAFTTQYTAGSVSTFQRWSQTYGRFEVRAKFPQATVKGLQSAIWMWPDNPTKYGAWPASGEIDIAEWYSQHYDRVIPYIHYNPWLGNDPNVTNNYCLVDQAWGYHTYVLEWTTQTLTISYDGKVCIVDNWNPMWPLIKPQPFDHPFMMALTSALGSTTNTVDAATPLPATTEVDYVRAWK